MTFDGNKSMNISYNFLNLPARVTRYQGTPNQQAIHYHYTATGRKMREQSVVNGSTTTRFYAGPFVFINNPYTDPAWINTPYGRFVQHNGQWTTEFYLKDHLGNTCLAMLRTSSSNHTISQESHYYPFGMRISTLSSEPMSLGNRKNRYMYNGKEYNEEFGFNLYDYGARFYDPQIARFHTLDPLSEKFTFQSPYVYASNNPILFIDYMGMMAQSSAEKKQQEEAEAERQKRKAEEAARRAQFIYFQKLLESHGYFSTGTDAANGGGSVGQPGTWESMIPIWGSGRAAVDHFDNGNYWRGAGYTALAISDVFLVKINCYRCCQRWCKNAW
jgi:RHS repeat-associated protein